MAPSGPTLANDPPPPVINAPERVYHLANNEGIPLVFQLQDPISQQDRELSVTGLGENNCDPTYDNNWSETGCSSVQLILNVTYIGKLVIPGAVYTPDPGNPPDPLKNVAKAPSGAIIADSLDGQGGPSFDYRIVGTSAQINATLATVIFVPDDTRLIDPPDPNRPPYEFTGSNPLRMQILSASGDGAGTAESKWVEIRIEGLNDPPVLDVPLGPIAVTAGATGVALPETASSFPEYTDEDPPEFTVTDPDADQGEGDDRMLLAAFVTCGQFHLRGGTFQIGDELEDLLKLGFNLPEQVADAILDIVPDEIKQLVFANEPPGNWQTAFVGVGELSEVNYALSQVSFRSLTDDQTCALVTFVTDLGNNGMPFQYIPPSGDDPSDPGWVPGFEIPIPLWDIGVTVFDVGEGGDPLLTVTVDPAALQDDPTDTSPIVFDVEFSRPVTGFEASDVDLSSSTAGGTLVPLVSGSGTSYTIEVSGMTSRGTVVAQVPADSAGWDLEPTITNGNADSATVGWAPPVTVTVAKAAAQADPAATGPIVFDVTFSEAVTGFSADDVDFAGSTAGGTLAALVSGSGAAYTVSVSGMTSAGLVSVTVPADAATSSALPTAPNEASNTATVYYDPDATPGDITVTVAKAGAQADPAATGPIVFDVTFSEAVTGFEAGDVDLALSTAGGTLSPIVAGSDAAYTVTVSGMTTRGQVTLRVPAGGVAAVSDDTLTNGDSNTASVGWAPPVTVTVAKAGAQADPAATGPIVFDVTFSEAVTGFSSGDVAFAGSTAGGTLTAIVSGSGAAYTVSVSGMTTRGTVAISIPASSVISSATPVGPNLGSNTASVAWAPPVMVTVAKAAAQADPTATGPVVFDVTFSEAVTGFDLADVDLSLSTTGGTLTPVVGGSGAAYTVTVGVTGTTVSGSISLRIPAGAATSALTPTGLSLVSNTASVAWTVSSDPGGGGSSSTDPPNGGGSGGGGDDSSSSSSSTPPGTGAPGGSTGPTTPTTTAPGGGDGSGAGLPTGSTPSTTAPAAGLELPPTGGDPRSSAGWAIALIGLGVVTLLAARRRGATTAS